MIWLLLPLICSFGLCYARGHLYHELYLLDKKPKVTAADVEDLRDIYNLKGGAYFAFHLIVFFIWPWMAAFAAGCHASQRAELRERQIYAMNSREWHLEQEQEQEQEQERAQAVAKRAADYGDGQNS